MIDVEPGAVANDAVVPCLVSVIIPVRNDALRLARCIASVRANDYPAECIELLVADNGSIDCWRNAARDAGALALTFPNIRVSEVRNRAADAASGKILVFVDADHELDSRWISSAVETLHQTGAGAVGAAYYAPDGGTWVQTMYDCFRARTPGLRQVEWLGSGSLAVWSDVFKAVEGFDSTLETCEDVDFCQRLRSGKRLLFSDNRLRSVHLGDPATLKALFFGELWRGRDNLRVSMRGPFTLRGMPSIVIPIVTFGCIVFAAAGLLTVYFGGARLVLAAVAGITLMATLRACRMLTRAQSIRVLTVPQAFAVAAVYEVSRALALVVRTPHRMRQSASLAASAVPGSGE